MTKFKLSPYPQYQESPHQWLGKVPSHWQLLPHRTLFMEIKDRGVPQEELLSVSISKGIIKQSDLLMNSSKKDSSNDDKSKYKLVRPNDIVFNKMRAWQGSIGVSRFKGIVSPAYIVQRLRTKQEPWFFHYLFRTPNFAKEAERWSYGITSDQWSLRAEDFKCIYSCVPPLEEQQKIVNFIQQQDRRIRRFVKNKKRLIELLREQHLCMLSKLFHRASTADDGKTVGWAAIPVRHLIQLRKLEIQDGNHGELHPKASDYVDEGIPFLMAKDIRISGLNLSTCAFLPNSVANNLRIGFALPNDVLLTHKATIGEVSLVPSQISTPFIMLSPQVTYYRILTDEISPNYLCVYMQSPQFQRQLDLLSSSQSTRNYIGLIAQRNLVIYYPTRDKQIEIEQQFFEANLSITQLIRKAQNEIELVQEYRSSLIADAVTGKIDLRSIPLEPTEESPEQDLSDISEDGFDADTEIGADEDELLEEAAHAN